MVPRHLEADRGTHNPLGFDPPVAVLRLKRVDPATPDDEDLLVVGDLTREPLLRLDVRTLRGGCERRRRR